MIYLTILITMMSIMTMVVYGIDKRRAIKQTRRVSEKALLSLSLCFGATGAIIGSIVFRHKTNQFKFKVLNALFFVVHVVVWVYLYDQQ